MNKMQSALPVLGGPIESRHFVGIDPGRHETRVDQLPLITQVLSIIRRRKWLILGSVAGALALGLLATLLMTPQYKASATIEIQRENAGLVEVGESDARAGTVDQEFYATQYGLLRARSLAERVAVAMRLYDNAKFFEMFGQGADWFEDERVVASASTRDQRVDAAAGILLDNFDLEYDRMSRLVDISFTSPDAQMSSRVIDTWSKEFIEQTLERRFEATSYARTFLERRLAQLRTRIDEAERRVVDYASRQGIINLPSGAAADPQTGQASERSLVVEDLAVLNRELADATADRVMAQSRLNAPRGQVAEALQNQAITSLREQRAQVAAEYQRLMVQFTPDYPPAKSLQGQLGQLDQAIAREEARVAGSLETTYRASLERERQLQARVNQLKTGVLDLRRRSIQYNIFQRDADTNRQLYDALLQRYKEIGVAGGVGVNNIAVVDAAEVPAAPASPNLPLNLLLALIAGLAVGIASAWALEQLDQGLRDPAQVEPELGLPLLGTIPRLSSGNPVDVLADRKSELSEAYVSLQATLSFATDHGVPRTIAVTSSRPAEGKTTTAYALARSLARYRRRVLLIDGDMRSPSIHNLVGVQNAVGLSNYLSGSDDLDAMLQSVDDELVIMSAGPHPPSAPELLEGARFPRLLTDLLEVFDHVVIDAPPVMGLADAPLIGSKVEGAIFVLEANGTHKSMAQVAIRRLRDADVPLMGAVLTKFDASRANYGYGYEYGYGYGYGSEARA